MVRLVSLSYHFILFEGGDSLNICMLFFTAAAYCACFGLHLVSTLFIQHSVYRKPENLLGANYFIRPMMEVVLPALSLFEAFLEDYPRWTRFVPRLVYLGIAGYSAVDLLLVPLVTPWPSALWTGTALSATLTAIIRCVSMLDLEMIYNAYFIVMLLFLIGIIPLVYAFEMRRRRLIVRQLAYDGETNYIDRRQQLNTEAISDDEKFERLGVLPLSQTRVLPYLYVGLEKCCDLFLDFALLRWLSLNFESQLVTLHSLRVLVYFPGETSRMEQIINQVKDTATLSIADSYFLYQLNRIKLIRQTSTISSVGWNRISDVSNGTRELKMVVRELWTEQDIQISQLRWVATARLRLEAQWHELLVEYPNSAPTHAEYAKFLMECCSNYRDAARANARVSALNDNTGLTVDSCFLMFLRTHPHYLKMGIISAHGHLRHQGRDRGSHEQASNPGVSDGSDDSNFLPELWFTTAIVKHAKLRLAFEQMLQKSRPTTHRILRDVMALSLVATFVLFTGLLAGLYSFYDSSAFQASYSQSIGKSRTANGASIMWLILHYANVTNRLPWVHRHADCSLVPEESHETYLDRALQQLSVSQAAFTEFTRELTEMSLTHTEVAEDLIGDLITSSKPLYFCENGAPLAARNSTIISHISNLYTLISRQSLDGTDWSDMYRGNNFWCAMMNSIDAIGDALSASRAVVFEKFIDTFGVYQTWFGKASIFSPFVYLAILYGGFPIATFFYLSEVRLFLRLMIKTDEDWKAEASQALGTSGESAGANVPLRREQCSSFLVIYISAISALFFGEAAVLLGVFENCCFTAADLERLEWWIFFSSFRLPQAYDACIHVLNAWFIDGFGSNLSTSEREILRGIELLDALDDATESLSTGKTASGASLAMDSQLDAPIIPTDCIGVEGRLALHEMYRCSSSNQLFLVVRRFAKDIVQHLPQSQGVLDYSALVELVHLVTYHLTRQVDYLEARLMIFVEERISTYQDRLVICYVVGVFLVAVIARLFLWFLQDLANLFDTAVVLLKRLPPPAVVANPELLNYLMQRNAKSDHREMSATQSVIHSSTSGILSINQAKVVEFTNQAVTITLGYSPEQLLGQSVTALFVGEDRVNFESQLALLMDRNVNAKYEMEVKCLADNGKEVHCQLTMFRLETDKSGGHYLLTIDDISKLAERRLAVEKAKEDSERLLHSIIPRAIVSRLKSGETGISLVVQLASVMFINVVKFSDYSCRLSPQQILGTLSSLFGEFDNALSEYPAITKIKVFGDTYMCASGLFSEGTRKEVEDIVDLAVTSLDIMEDFNIKTNTNLSVRIGINTGGPIIAGVLGTDKLAFDIIGDPINVAARLQSTAPPNTIQISTETQSHVAHANYQMSVRRKVFLKGKGECTTYLIRSNNASTLITDTRGAS
jgi:PAS domain S-box-containing protein